VKSISGKQLAKILERKGWTLQRINGSHHIYKKEGQTARISIPIHGNTALKIGLLKHLMKVAEIDEADL